MMSLNSLLVGRIKMGLTLAGYGIIDICVRLLALRLVDACYAR